MFIILGDYLYSWAYSILIFSNWYSYLPISNNFFNLTEHEDQNIDSIDQTTTVCVDLLMCAFTFNRWTCVTCAESKIIVCRTDSVLCVGVCVSALCAGEST